DLPAQITFNDIFAILDGMHDLRKLLLGEVFGPDARVDIRLREDIQRVRGANAVDIAQGDIDTFIRRNFYSNDACHKLEIRLTLTLFVPRVGTDDADNSLATDDFTILAKFLNRCSNFHTLKSFLIPQRCGLPTSRKATFPI